MSFIALGFHATRPPDEDGGAQSAVVGALLGARGKASGLGIGDPSIVGDEDDQGVLSRAPLLQEIQELAASVVEPLDHAPVVCDGQRRSSPAVPGQKPLRGRVRVVRHHGGVPDHPRSVLLFGEGHEVFDGLHRDPAYLQPSVSMPVASGHSVGEAASRIVVLPPLTTLEAQVPLVAEESGQGRSLFEE